MKRKTWEDYCDTNDYASNRRTWEQYTVNTLSVGMARSILNEAEKSGLSGMSKINPSFTKEGIHEILVGAIGGKQDNEKIDRLIAKNIIREFLEQAKKVTREEPHE